MATLFITYVLPFAKLKNERLPPCHWFLVVTTSPPQYIYITPKCKAKNIK
jgi:hypothetical protein